MTTADCQALFTWFLPISLQVVLQLWCGFYSSCVLVVCRRWWVNVLRRRMTRTLTSTTRCGRRTPRCYCAVD